MLRALATPAVALLLAAVTAAPAFANDAGSITHTAGAVSATLQWDRADYGVANPQLYVVRSGIRYDITIADLCGDGCILVPDDASTPPELSMVKVADLDGDGEPEVLVDVFSGGAHCCVTTRLLTWDGTGYQPKDIEWRDGGYELRDVDGDGRPELVGQDPRFWGAFAAFAISPAPPMILHVERGTTVDVTRSFSAVVTANAKEMLHILRRLHRRDDARGIVAVYAADEELLGREPVALREVDRQRRLHRVTPGFKRLLLRRLHAWGYR